MSTLAFLEPDTLCNRCGHMSDYHRTQTGECTAELQDLDGTWLRCGCSAWMGSL